MTKAKTPKAATAKAPAPETPPMPRLVETDPGVRDVSAPGSAEPAPGEDNNKHLAWLQGRFEAFADRLGALGVEGPRGGPAADTFDLAIAAIVEARGQADERAGAKDQVDKLAAFLLARPDFVAPDGGAGDAAIILITDLDGAIGTWRQQTEDGDKEINALREKLGFIPGIVMGLGLDDFEPIEGEDPIGTLERFMIAAGKALVAERGESAEDARKLHKAAVRNLTELFKDLPDTAAITLRFAEGNEFIRQVQPINIKREELIPAGAKVILDKRIDFDPGVAPAFVNGAFLIAGKKSMRCEISNLRIGGGSMAALPAGFLEFGSAAHEKVSS